MPLPRRSGSRLAAEELGRATFSSRPRRKQGGALPGLLNYLAASNGMDPSLFAEAMSRHRALVDQDVRDAKALGATGTPHTFVNGRRVKGAIKRSALLGLVQEELLRAEGIQRKTSLSGRGLYDRLVRADGGGKSDDETITNPHSLPSDFLSVPKSSGLQPCSYGSWAAPPVHPGPTSHARESMRGRPGRSLERSLRSITRWGTRNECRRWNRKSGESAYSTTSCTPVGSFYRLTPSTQTFLAPVTLTLPYSVSWSEATPARFACS